MVTLLQSIVVIKSGVLGNMIGDKLFRNIFNKTMEIDYEMLLDKKILEKRELAMKVIEQGRFNNFTGNFNMKKKESNYLVANHKNLLLREHCIKILLLLFWMNQLLH